MACLLNWPAKTRRGIATTGTGVCYWRLLSGWWKRSPSNRLSSTELLLIAELITDGTMNFGHVDGATDFPVHNFKNSRNNNRTLSGRRIQLDPDEGRTQFTDTIINATLQIKKNKSIKRQELRRFSQLLK
jgi:hypothetical protein